MPTWPTVVDVDDQDLAVVDDTGALTWVQLDHRIRLLCAVSAASGLPQRAPVVVADVAVFGVPHCEFGQTIVAALQFGARPVRPDPPVPLWSGRRRDGPPRIGPSRKGSGPVMCFGPDGGGTSRPRSDQSEGVARERGGGA